MCRPALSGRTKRTRVGRDRRLTFEPTRDQVGEDPASDSYLGRYLPRERKPAGEGLVYSHLALQWPVPKPRSGLDDNSLTR
jgi:hypothetical protein